MCNRATRGWLRPIVALMALAMAGGIAFAGDLIPPPGPVSPTMKSLVSVEPRTEVNAVNTPTNGVSIFVISSPGSYYLSGNITGASGKHGVEIASSNVTLDLNGFAVVGVPGSQNGISVLAVEQVTITNGVLRGWGWTAVHASAVISGRLHGLQVSGSQLGIWAGNGTIVTDCTVNDCDNQGITTTGAVVLERCTAMDNGTHGIVSQAASTIRGCTVARNGGFGIIAGPGAVVESCSAWQNFGGGVFMDAGGTVSGSSALGNTGSGFKTASDCTITRCTARQNSVDGIEAGERCMIESCTANGNADDGISFRAGSMVRANTSALNAYGLYDAGSAGSRVDDNLAYDNSHSGFLLAAGQHHVVRNTGRSNGDVDFAISPASQYGQIVTAGPVIGPEIGAWANFAESVNASAATAMPPQKPGDKRSEMPVVKSAPAREATGAPAATGR